MEVKQAGMIRSEFTFPRVEVSHEEVGGPVSVWHILSQKRSKCIRTAARRERGETARPSGFQGCMSWS